MIDGRLLLFEDDHASWFEPVALLRSVARLRSGAWTHAERWERLAPSREIALLCRGALAEVERECGVWGTVVPGGARTGGSPDTLFVAAALGRPDPAVRDRILGLAAGRALVARGRLVAARAAGERAARLVDLLLERAGDGAMQWDSPVDASEEAVIPELEAMGFDVREIEATVPSTLADLLASCVEVTQEDFAFYSAAMPTPESGDYPGTHFIRRDHIRLGEGVQLDPGVVLDARDGPILIGPETRVMANAVVQGPAVIGPGCLVKPVAVLAHGVSLGPVCKVGGEVEASIFLGYSNKQHAGFLGHSVIGEWVNLGAATDTSDLKNNYGEVRLVVAGRERGTGSRHIGSFLGDHTKTGIQTRLNTGTVAGIFSNLFGGGTPPKEIPSFAWGGEGRWVEHHLEKALEVAHVVTARRGVTLSPGVVALATRIREETSARRRAWLSQFPPA